jgi:hypothetical protein
MKDHLPPTHISPGNIYNILSSQGLTDFKLGRLLQVLLDLAVFEKCGYCKYTCFFGLVQKIISIRKGLPEDFVLIRK